MRPRKTSRSYEDLEREEAERQARLRADSEAWQAKCRENPSLVAGPGPSADGLEDEAEVERTFERRMAAERMRRRVG